MNTIVLHSGGQDSSTCLAWAAKSFGAENVQPVSFDYGQKHRVEIDCAARVTRALGVAQPVLLPAEALSMLGGAALTSNSVPVDADATDTGNVYAEEHGLPSTFVPGRNMLFLTLAAAYGAKHGAYDLVTGICEADASGYPDCRQSFRDAAQTALSEALDETITIHAPLLLRNKAETWKLADDLGVLQMIVDETHTCYHGEHTLKHAWGYGCGGCPACIERQRGWDQYWAGEERGA